MTTSDIRCSSDNISETGKPTVWLLSAYRADSHAAWADWLTQELSDINWRRLELPGRYFRWRIRGNPLSWLDALPQDNPDLILATSMVDLATIKGLHPRLAATPACYYFHENQFAYPIRAQQSSSVEPQIVQLYGALSAQHLLFNSVFNRDSFLDGVELLLHKMPDAVPPDIRARLQKKCDVLPVAIDPVVAAADRDKRLILWNHRWEYDKNPELFVDAMLELDRQGIDFRLALLGTRPKRTPAALQRLRQELPNRILVDGKLDKPQYRELLGSAAIVVSTALHEFQGLGVLEACSAGVRPLVPNALCYPEQYEAGYLYPAGDRTALVDRLLTWLDTGLPPKVDVSAWYSASLLAEWRDRLACSDA